MTSARSTNRILSFAKKRGVLRPRDLVDTGIPRAMVYRLHKSGLLDRVGRGLYRVRGAKVTQAHSLVEVVRHVPNGIVCLLSALQFHELTTQLPHQVWIAIDVKAWKPRVGSQPVRIVRFSGAALTAGVERHSIEGVDARIYSAAKTVADCFKYRNKIGLEIAIEALRDYLRGRAGSRDELWRYAKICRVANVIRPYLEATA